MVIIFDLGVDLIWNYRKKKEIYFFVERQKLFRIKKRLRSEIDKLNFKLLGFARKTILYRQKSLKIKETSAQSFLGLNGYIWGNIGIAEI